MAPLITGLAIMPFSTPHLVAMASYSPVEITCSSACLSGSASPESFCTGQPYGTRQPYGSAPQYGNAPQYSGQYGQPAAPVAPPREVLRAVQLMFARVALGVLNTLIAFASVDSIKDTIRNNDPSLTQQQIDRDCG